MFLGTLYFYTFADMDEEEELYREMNEDDPFYMGDKDEDDDEEVRDDDDSSRDNGNGGCLGVIAIFIIAASGIFLIV